MENQLQVQVSEGLIVAYVRGVPSESLLRQCQAEVVALARETGIVRVLYDALQMADPGVDVALSQRAIDEEQGFSLRRAILVPDTRLAYLARLAFGEGDYRVFYDDIEAARRWLRG